MKIERFEDIEAWQLDRELTRKVYSLTRKEPFARDFGLKGQIQDAAGSSMHNIAEGFDSVADTKFIRFLRLRNAPALSFRASFTWLSINSILRNLNLRMSMITPGARVPPFVV